MTFYALRQKFNLLRVVKAERANVVLELCVIYKAEYSSHMVLSIALKCSSYYSNTYCQRLR